MTHAEEKETSSKSEGYRFGEYFVTAEKDELWRHTGDESEPQPVDIQQRVLNLLCYLIEHRARNVSKEELHEAVWPGTIVTEAALSRAVMKARKALDDSASDPAYIRTVHGQGFRFIAEVAPLSPVDAAPPEDHTDRRGDLLRLATTYGAGAWLINQAAAMIWEAFEWDRWPQQLLLGISVAGFPLMLGIAWFYRSTPGGLQLRSERRFVDGVSPVRPRGAYRWVLVMLVLALGLSLSWNLRTVEPATEDTAERVVVWPAVNQTGHADLEWLSLGMMSLLHQHLQEAGLEMVSTTAVLAQRETGGSAFTPEHQQMLHRTEGAAHFVEVEITAHGNQYSVTGRLTEDTTTTTLPTFGADAPAAAVRRLGQHLVQTLNPQITLRNPEESSGDAFLDQVFARGMYEQLSGNLERARDLLEVAANAQPDTFAPNYQLAVVMRALGDHTLARSLNERLLDQALTARRSLHIAQLSNELGILADLGGRLDEAAAHYEEGLRWARQGAHHQRRAILLVNYAILMRATGEPQRAQEYLGLATAAYQAAGVELLPGDLYITLGNTSADSGDLDQAQDQYQQALANYRAANRRKGEALALSNLSWAAERLGDYDASTAYLEQSEALRAEIGDEPGLVKIKVRRADLLFTLGRYDEASALASDIKAHPYARTEPRIYAVALNYDAFIALQNGRHDEAIASFEEAITIEADTGHTFGHVRALLGLAQTYLVREQLGQAQHALDAVTPMLSNGNLADFALKHQTLLARLAYLRGDTQQARQLLRDTAEQARTAGNNARLATVALQLAAWSMQDGDIAGVEQWVGTASDAAPTRGQVLFAQAELAAMHNDWQRSEARLSTALPLIGQWCQSRVQSLTQLIADRPANANERLAARRGCETDL